MNLFPPALQIEITYDNHSCTVYTKERFKKKEFIGTYNASIQTIMLGIKSLLVECGCTEEEADRMMRRSKIESDDNNIIDIVEHWRPGWFKIRIPKKIFGLRYYKTIGRVKASSYNQATIEVAKLFPNHKAVDFFTQEPFTY